MTATRRARIRAHSSVGSQPGRLRQQALEADRWRQGGSGRVSEVAERRGVAEGDRFIIAPQSSQTNAEVWRTHISYQVTRLSDTRELANRRTIGPAPGVAGFQLPEGGFLPGGSPELREESLDFESRSWPQDGPSSPPARRSARFPRGSSVRRCWRG